MQGCEVAENESREEIMWSRSKKGNVSSRSESMTFCIICKKGFGSHSRMM